MLVCAKNDSGRLSYLPFSTCTVSTSRFIVGTARSVLGSVDTVYCSMHAGRVPGPYPSTTVAKNCDPDQASKM